jgi:cytochrome c biogenesis protein CcdA
MVDTFTSAGCGGRTRRIIAVALFTAGAVVAAVALGATLGAIGAALPGRTALGVAAAVAVIGALRELGVVRVPLPDMRRQVPEPWRRDQPLAVWSTGYGAILGAGFGTFQPVVTFWVVCAAAIALGSPVASAACLAMFGLGRAVMVVAPGRDGMGRLTRAHRFVRPSNAVALALLAAALIPSVAAAAVAPPFNPPSGQSDPSISGTTIAYTDQANGVQNVVVKENDAAPPFLFLGGRQPSLDGEQLAYVDDLGIRIVAWRTGQETGRIPRNVSRPAISGRRIAYVEVRGNRRFLRVRNLVTGAVRTLSVVGPGVDLGRPALRKQLVAWTEGSGSNNILYLQSLTRGPRKAVIDGRRTGAYFTPSLLPNHLAWIVSRDEFSTVVIRRARAEVPLRRHGAHSKLRLHDALVAAHQRRRRAALLLDAVAHRRAVVTGPH